MTTPRRPAAPLIIVALFALLVTGCVPDGSGTIVDRRYQAPYTSWSTITVGKVTTPVPVYHSAQFELKLVYDGGKVYWCDVSEKDYSIPNNHIYDCKNQHEVMK